MPRHFPAAEKLMLEVEGLAYQADLVLVAVLPNDINDTRSGLGAVQVSSGGYLVSHRLGPVAEWISLHSHLGRVLLVRLARWLERVEAAEAASEGDRASMQTDLAAMAEMAAQHGARFAIIGIPQSDYGSEAELDRRLIPWSAREGIAYISAWPAMRAADGGTPLHWEEGHCTPAGYAVIAQAAYEGLVQYGFAP